MTSPNLQKPIETASRRTGRTFRRLLYALEAVSRGKQIAYISDHQDSVSSAYRMATSILMGTIDGWENAIQNRTIRFPYSGGTLYFYSASEDLYQKLGGCRFYDIIEDCEDYLPYDVEHFIKTRIDE